MAEEIVWTEPALADLDAIADCIAVENPVAAVELVRRVFRHVEPLADHPESGSRPQELKRSRYRQIVEPPCRVFYRYDDKTAYILHVMRAERLLRPERLVVERGYSGTHVFEPGEDLRVLKPRILKTCFKKVKKSYRDCTLVVTIDFMPPFSPLESWLEPKIESNRLALSEIRFQARRVFLLVMTIERLIPISGAAESGRFTLMAL